jgi:hypothetical protein
MGDGSSPCSLSRAGIGRPDRRGCQLPDAILHGKRSYRPRSRAVQRLAATGLLSEAFQLASADGCATGLRTRSRHVCDCLSASRPLSAGSAAVVHSAFARCHGSRLFTLRLPLHPQASGCVFTIAGVSGGFHGSCRDLVSSPLHALTLCRLSASFLWLTSFRRPPESRARAGAQ